MSGAKASKPASGLRRKAGAKLLGRRRAAFGIDAAIMIGFILGMMVVLMAAGPQILQWFAGGLIGGSRGAYSLLIELPVISDSPSQKPASNASAATWVGWAVANLYGTLQQVALALLAVVLIIAAMCYIFETFRFMSEGTAMNIILNSMFTLIMIFAVRYIYNGVAAAINAFTGWPDVGGTGLIIQGGHEIDALIGAMGGSVLDESWELVVRFFGSTLLFIISTSVLVLTTMMGAVRLLIIGCLAAALPLLLMLRLIPPVKHLADSLIETVIGMMFASVIAAVVLHFGYVLVSETGLDGMAKLAIALAAFAGAAYMSTMFAGRLGGLFTTAGMMASAATSMTTGLLLSGATIGAGGAGGVVAKVAELKSAGVWSALSGEQKAGEFIKSLAKGAAVAGAATIPGIAAGRDTGKVFAAGVGALPGAIHAAQEGVEDRVGSAVEGLLHGFAVTPAEGESAGLGKKWAEKVLSMSDREAGELLASKIGVQLDREKAGREFKATLTNLSKSPIMQHRIKLGLDRLQGLPQNERTRMLAEALKRKDEYEEKVREALGKGPYISPDFEALDKKPDFYDNILDRASAGIYGETVKARMYSLMREGYDSKYRKGEIDYDHGWNLMEQVWKMKDKEAADWAEETFGVRIPKDDRKAVGHGVKQLVKRVGLENPYLLANLVDNIKKKSRILQRAPDEDLKSLENNTKWVKSRSKLREREVKDIFDTGGDSFASFWGNVAPAP